MIVQYASDLHLDYGQNYEYVLNKGFEEEGNVLILAYLSPLLGPVFLKL